MNQNTYIWITGAVVAIVFIVIGMWFFFFRFSTPTQTNTAANSFGTPADTSTGVTDNTSPSNGTQPVNGSGGQVSQTKIFQITAGPVVGATLIQTLHPTTTVARYINQDDGHVYDLPLDVAGAVPRVVSNVTIPGGARVIWVEGGAAAVMQYLDGSTVKTVYLGFAASNTASSTLPTVIKFLPDAIEDIAASPDGKSVAYLLKTASGADGYIAKDDGTGSKKLFSLPLSQILISWPSQGTLLAQTKSAAGVPGIVFSIDAKSGVVRPLVYAQGLTAIANPSFSKIIYQTVADGADKVLSYSHDVKTGLDYKLAFNPYPEKCLWGVYATSTMFCASPLQTTPVNYLDLWHQGTASAADTIYSFNASTNVGTIFAIPGSYDGGVASDVLEMALSPDEHYLSFTTKGDRAVWGVRLTQ